jgi:hypothetical protein
MTQVRHCHRLVQRPRVPLALLLLAQLLPLLPVLPLSLLLDP